MKHSYTRYFEERCEDSDRAGVQFRGCEMSQMDSQLGIWY